MTDETTANEVAKEETAADTTIWAIRGALGTLGYAASWLTKKPSWKNNSIASFVGEVGAVFKGLNNA